MQWYWNGKNNIFYIISILFIPFEIHQRVYVVRLPIHSAGETKSITSHTSRIYFLFYEYNQYLINGNNLLLLISI